LLSEDDVSEYILNYDTNAADVGLVHIPEDHQRASTRRGSRSSPSQLASSPAKKLSFVAMDQYAVSVSPGSIIRRLLGAGRGDRRHMMAKWWPLLGLKPWMDHRLELGEPRRSEEQRGVLAVSWCLCCARHEDGGNACDVIGRRNGHPVRSGTRLGYI
jgi:hypothetical protein